MSSLFSSFLSTVLSTGRSCFGLTEERSRDKALLFEFPALILVDWLADKYFNIVSDVFLLASDQIIRGIRHAIFSFFVPLRG